MAQFFYYLEKESKICLEKVSFIPFVQVGKATLEIHQTNTTKPLKDMKITLAIIFEKIY